MEHKRYTCDINLDDSHSDDVKFKKVPVMFDHDQEDGKSKTEPYFEMKELDICGKHFKEMTEERKLIYAYGAMGYNKYSLGK